MILVIAVLAATALLSGQLTVYMAVRTRGSRSARFMAMVMGATAWWAAWNAAEYMAPGLPAKIAFANLQYLAIAAIPVLWFALGLWLDQEEREGTTRLPPLAVRLLLGVIPLVTAVLVWTDTSLGLVRHSFRLDVQSGFPVIAKEFGPWFWVHSAYSYVFIIVGTVLILRALHATQGIRRAQRVTLVVGTLLPVAANLVYLSGIISNLGVDPTPLAFSLTGLLALLNLSRFRFLALVNHAQATAIEQLREAVLILDRDGNLAYLNGAARGAFPSSVNEVGKRLVDVGPPFSSLRLDHGSAGPAGGEGIVLPYDGRLYESRTGDIARRGRRIGFVVTLFDVTRRVTAEEELRRSNLDLEQKIGERTRALEESNLKLTAELEQRRRAERQLTHDVLHDSLTGMANRSFALSRLEQVLTRSHRDPALSYAVLHFDFDGFKAINDRFGRGAGDVFLCEVAARMKHSIRDVDLAARVGGDEFVIILDGLPPSENLEEIVDRIVDNLGIPIYFGSSAVVPSASLGIVTGRPEYKDPQAVLHDAEIAVQKAKSSGRNLRVVFSEDMRLLSDQRNLLSAALRTAISSGEISLAFQPIVTLDAPVATNPPTTIMGWEVLARWRHSQLGPITPDRFIPLAEETGLIVPLGAYILLETLKTAVALRAEGLLDDERGTKYFAVNVSAIQFGQRDFAEFVLASLDRLELPRAVIHLELTESAIMENREVATNVIQRLTAEGINFKLDDFGTGYSSLGYLHRIPISCVKIDRSFISRLDLDTPGENSAGVVRGMISLSHELRKTVVAEGIETETQARMLRECGCDFAQGYLYGKPMDRDSLFQTCRASRGPVASAQAPAEPAGP